MWNIEVSVSEVLICASTCIYGHAFETLCVWLNDCNVCFSGAQHKGFNFAIFGGCGYIVHRVVL